MFSSQLTAAVNHFGNLLDGQGIKQSKYAPLAVQLAVLKDLCISVEGLKGGDASVNSASESTIAQCRELIETSAPTVDDRNNRLSPISKFLSLNRSKEGIIKTQISERTRELQGHVQTLVR
jgi:hypothetical protein